ncbi:MAG: integrase [Stenotrophomonas sp.]|uniref:phage integrase Arm DNA-binding domain-containing protein n=1 Tax=Stenotrophomonas sp. TaxID=69392 RepID=UPI001352C5D0|nr:phage integrase Arm DNA-binding domain-containing protein [Stenotrophomonas sp.]MTI72539.1 integrase [Stenotrophomonas sp.]MTI72599.1 integrase [Stenotrophomonas sp.]
MAPRPRKKRNAGLPANLYTVGKGYYRYRRPDTGTWHGMGNDRAKAVAAANQLNGRLMTGADLVADVMGDSVSLNGFLDYYEAEVLPPRQLAQATLDLYAVRLRQIRAALGAQDIGQITIGMVSTFLDGLTPRASNQARAYLVDVFNYAAAKGLVADNPPEATIPRIDNKTRKRHTVKGVRKIYAEAEPWLQNAIDLALLTAQRREDILAMRFDDIRDGALHVAQHKTRRASDAGWIRLPMTPQLKSLVARCRDEVPSPFLIHRKPERRVASGRHWTQVDNRYLTRAFKAARDAANPYPDWSPAQQPGFHELRALSLHLYKKAGKDGQKLAGHSTRKMTKNYEADHEEVVWTEAVADLDLSNITG